MRYDPTISTFCFSSGRELLHAFEANFFDLIFLDIEMTAPNGLAVGAELVKYQPAPLIVFTTQSLNYAVRGYGIAFRYLPKPIEYDTFSATMRLALEKILPQKLTITCRNEQVVVPISQIIYFEVVSHEIVFHLSNGNKISTYCSLGEMKSKLCHHSFVQPHKSYCVNMDYIDRVTKQTISLTNGDTIPIGRSRKDNFQNQLNLFIKGNNAL